MTELIVQIGLGLCGDPAWLVPYSSRMMHAFWVENLANNVVILWLFSEAKAYIAKLRRMVNLKNQPRRLDRR